VGRMDPGLCEGLPDAVRYGRYLSYVAPRADDEIVRDVRQPAKVKDQDIDRLFVVRRGSAELRSL